LLERELACVVCCRSFLCHSLRLVSSRVFGPSCLAKISATTRHHFTAVMTRSRHFIFIFILATCIEPSSSFGFHCQRRALKLGARELWRGPQCLPLVLGATREGGSWTTLCQRNTNACYSINTRLHLAGGFEAPPSKSSKKKQKRSNVAAAQDEISTASKSASVSSRQNKEPEPLLDRFGLPLVPTEEDIFPRMPPGTELISSSLNENDNIVTSQDQLDALLEKHMMINLTALHAMSASQYGRTNHMKVRMLHQSPPGTCFLCGVFFRSTWYSLT
jgi:hypothetical protein